MTQQPQSVPSPVILRLVDALALADAADYLREQATLRNDSSDERTNPVPLQQSDKAA